MAKIINKFIWVVWKKNKMPAELEYKIIVLVHKKDNQCNYGNYRPKCLSMVVYKLFINFGRKVTVVKHLIEV